MTCTSKLQEHQAEAIEHLLEWKVGALFMEAGTGKTRVACELISAVPDIDLVLWLGPLRTLKGGEGIVPDEVNKWGLIKAPIMYVGVESISGSDRIYLETMAAVESHSNVFVVVDESLKIKNYEAKRTRRIIEIGKKVQYKLILNGTPLSRNILDIWSQMEFLSPKILNMPLAQYKNTFCNYTTITKKFGSWKRTREIITGYENIDYLHSLIRHYVYECDLKLAIKQRYHSRNYYLTEDDMEEYEWIKGKFLNDEMLEWRNNNIFLEMTNKMQHSYCCTPDKFNVVDEILQGIDPARTIIFCRYIKSQEACAARYPKCKVLSFQKESFGLNLQRYCYTIYFDKVWDYALMEQSGHRTYRVGQDEDCEYYDLTGNVGLDRLIDRNIEKKVNMTEYFKRVSREQLKKDL